MTYKSIAVPLLGLGLLVAPAFGAEPARPGTVNYVEGAASIDGQQINAKQIGDVTLDAGSELTTGANGKAEVLLTPGVFLRVDSDSEVKMISPDLALTQVELDKGRAGVEVDEIHDTNNLQIIDAGVTTRLKKTGFYEFDANRPEVLVFKGKADVQVAEGKTREVKGGHELLLTGGTNGQPIAKEKPSGFKTDQAHDELFNWSKLRSQYLAEANNEMAGEYASGYGAGWYWDPDLYGYTYLGGGPFYSPFGWGFYPFGWGGWYGGGWGYYGRGYYGHGYYGHPYHSYGGAHGFRGGGGPHAYGGGFHGGMGGGGFHGGMGGGGFHGGGGGHR